MARYLTTESLILADGSVTTSFLKACFSCGEDSSQIPEGIFLSIFGFQFFMNGCLVIEKVVLRTLTYLPTLAKIIHILKFRYCGFL